MTEQQVRESSALWVAEHARPYSAIEDNHLSDLFHPDARTHKPSHKTLSTDIKRMYHTTQLHIVTMLAATIGALHIGLDLFQSSSGFDFLGIVLFHQLLEPGKQAVINRFVLECLSFDGAHTGIALAKCVLAVLDKFEIRDRVWGVVCDNASNNAAMMEELETKRLNRMNGRRSRVFCVLHVLNLVAKAALKPFHAKRKQLTEDEQIAGDESEDEFEAHAFEFPEDVDIDEHDDGVAGSHILQEHSDDEADQSATDDEADYMVPKMAKGSADESLFERAKKVLFKVAKLARKLRYSPAAKAAFKAACVKLEVLLPHNIQRDMKVRWNSTDLMLEDAYRTFKAILDYQNNTRFTPHKQLLREEDLTVIELLLKVLKPIRKVSDILSRAGVAMLADVIPHYDSLTHEYEELRKDTSLPLYIRQAAHRARSVLNKYYSLTDDSDLYRLAILLHLSMRVNYIKRAGWEPEWIANAVDIAVTCWREHYQPKTTTADEESSTLSQFGNSSFMDDRFSVVSNTTLSTDATCVHEFVNGPIAVDKAKNGRSIPISNPLGWWYAQRIAGNEMDGLTQMALDVLSIPASSVDVERAFSFAGSIVTKRRHNLAPLSIQATASLGSYSKAGMVQRGCLELPQKGKKAN